MKKFSAIISAVLMLVLCSCSVQEEPQSEAETSKSISESDASETEEPEKNIYEPENELDKFEATDMGQIQLFNDYYAYVYGFNRDVDLSEGFRTTISSYELETGEAEILFRGNAYMEYTKMLHIGEVAFSNPWIFTGKNIFSKGIENNPDIEYSLGGRPYECDIDFNNKRFVFVDRNDKSKLYSKMIETGEEKLLFDVSDEGGYYFINDPKVCSGTGNTVFVVCEYEAASTRRLVCIDYCGKVVFEESITESFYHDIRWLNDEEFALFALFPDEEIEIVKIYNINSGLESEQRHNFLHDAVQNDVMKSYPYAVISEYVPESDFCYRLWLYNFEDGTAEEIYTSPTGGIIHGFDLSPSGETLAWIENADVRYIKLK